MIIVNKIKSFFRKLLMGFKPVNKKLLEDKQYVLNIFNILAEDLENTRFKSCSPILYTLCASIKTDDIDDFAIWVVFYARQQRQKFENERGI